MDDLRSEHYNPHHALSLEHYLSLVALGLGGHPNDPRDVRASAMECPSPSTLHLAAEALDLCDQPHNANILRKQMRRLQAT